MDKRASPQEEKIRDYLNQRSNSYGGNDKSSRKAIRVRKSWVNRSYRRHTNNLLNTRFNDWDYTGSRISSSYRIEWKKYADECLLESFEQLWCDSSRVKHMSERKKLLQRDARKRLNRTKSHSHLADKFSCNK